MKAVFADASYWVAIANPRDEWADAAERAAADIGDAQIVTTQEVLTEFLNYYCAYGRRVRATAAAIVAECFEAWNVTVIPQSDASFRSGLELYADRLDKAYSLTDCVSMVAMKEHGISAILSSDGHFRQAGFSVLMKQ